MKKFRQARAAIATAAYAVLDTAASAVFGLVYPRGCAACGVVRLDGDGVEAVCRECRDGIRLIGLTRSRCRRCSSPLPRPLEEGEDQPARCRACRNRVLYFKSAVAWAAYSGPVKEMIVRMKREEDRAIAAAIGRETVAVVSGAGFGAEIDCVVAVPAERPIASRHDFNQAEVMASVVARGLRSRHIESALAKVRRTAKQAWLPSTARFPNVKDAFRAVRKRGIRGKTVLLVDDVMTTGATAAECSKALLEGGAKRVYAAAAARAVL